jgi:DNA polymerase III epsilon subunit-like protein
MRIVFMDTETTSLRHDRRAWEIAAIVRDHNVGDGVDDPIGHNDTEHTWLIHAEDLDLGNADLKSLAIGRFYDRHPEATGELGRMLAWERSALMELERLTRHAYIVGAVPSFDVDVLSQRMRANGICPSWHYHIIDVETLAAGALKMQPKWNFDSILAHYGLTYDEADRHTAMGDTRMVRDLYDAVMKGSVTE